MLKGEVHSDPSKEDATQWQEWDCPNCGGSYMHSKHVGLWRSPGETQEAIKKGYRK